MLMAKCSAHVGRKHDLFVSDAIYATNGVADLVRHGDGCRYVIACGDKQRCVVTTADGDVSTVPGRNLRAVREREMSYRARASNQS